jgi:hypothetical protein
MTRGEGGDDGGGQGCYRHVGDGRDGMDDTEKESGDGNALQYPWSLARLGFIFI